MMNVNDSTTNKELAGQVVIVTGGGRGIGRAIAQALAAAGAVVAVTARSADQLAETVSLIEMMGGRAITLTANVIDQHAVESMVNETERQLGPVDLLVNNAGSLVAIGPVWEADPIEWWRDVEINLRGTFLCARAVLPGMVARRRGRIINTSGGGATQPIPYFSAYPSSKSAILRFTDTLALETQEYGISVFALVIGPARTGMMAHIIESDAGQKWFPEGQTWLSEPERWVPVERGGQLAVFLASGKADVLSGRLFDDSDNEAELVRHSDEIKKNDLYTLRMRKL